MYHKILHPEYLTVEDGRALDFIIAEKLGWRWVNYLHDKRTMVSPMQMERRTKMVKEDPDNYAPFVFSASHSPKEIWDGTSFLAVPHYSTKLVDVFDIASQHGVGICLHNGEWAAFILKSGTSWYVLPDPEEPFALHCHPIIKAYTPQLALCRMLLATGRLPRPAFL
jgi:hypothetical protein